MTFRPDSIVRDIALAVPRATSVFDAYRIDYCCGGQRSLSEAAERAGVPVATLIGALEAEVREPADEGASPDWTKKTAAELVGHVVGTHHAYTRDAFRTIEPLLSRVVERHGGTHPELGRLQELFGSLRSHLEQHMMKEERVLFPHIVALDRAASGAGRAPAAPFGTVAGPIHRMMREHEADGAVLHAMHDLTNGYAPPEGACTSYRALFAALAELEHDLFRHIHLENDILFPAAQALERTARVPRDTAS